MTVNPPDNGITIPARLHSAGAQGEPKMRGQLQAHVHMTIAATAARVARVPNSVSSQVKCLDRLRGGVNLRERSRGFLQTPYLPARAREARCRPRALAVAWGRRGDAHLAPPGQGARSGRAPRQALAGAYLPRPAGGIPGAGRAPLAPLVFRNGNRKLAGNPRMPALPGTTPLAEGGDVAGKSLEADVPLRRRLAPGSLRHLSPGAQPRCGYDRRARPEPPLRAAWLVGRRPGGSSRRLSAGPAEQPRDSPRRLPHPARSRRRQPLSITPLSRRRFRQLPSAAVPGAGPLSSR
jgi:hypothetical protein